jgi:hypothetical protein
MQWRAAGLELMPERRPDRMSDRISEYICQKERQRESEICIDMPNIHFQMVCRKRCQNSVSGWESLKECVFPVEQRAFFL